MCSSDLASPQTIARPFPPAPALLSPARTAGEKNRERGAGRALRVLRSWYFSRLPRPGWAEQRRRGRIKISDVRRLRSRQVSEISVPSEQRKLPGAQRRDPDCGSPFLCLADSSTKCNTLEAEREQLHEKDLRTVECRRTRRNHGDETSRQQCQIDRQGAGPSEDGHSQLLI